MFFGSWIKNSGAVNWGELGQLGAARRLRLKSVRTCFSLYVSMGASIHLALFPVYSCFTFQVDAGALLSTGIRTPWRLLLLYPPNQSIMITLHWYFYSIQWNQLIINFRRRQFHDFPTSMEVPCWFLPWWPTGMWYISCNGPNLLSFRLVALVSGA